MISVIRTALAAALLLALGAVPALAQTIIPAPGTSGGGASACVVATPCTVTQAIDIASTSDKGLTINLPTGNSQNAISASSNSVVKFSVSSLGTVQAFGNVKTTFTQYFGFSDGSSNRVQWGSTGGSGCPSEVTWYRDTNTGSSPSFKFSSDSFGGPMVIGGCPSGTPTARAIQGEGGTGTNIGAANFTIQTGLGAGSGTASQTILRSSIPTSSGSTAQSYGTGLVITWGTAKLTSYTVATLPTCSTVGAGAMAFVTDATTPTYNGTLTGSGAVGVPVACDGTAWHSV